MSSQLATLTVLGKRRASGSHVGTVRLVGSASELSCSEQSDFDQDSEPAAASSTKTFARPILINGKLTNPTKKRYKCTSSGCQKAYTKPSRLAEHERTHTGERPFVCETCKKAYFRESHLHAHTRSHLPEAERPLACEFEGCEKRFWTAQHLKVHQDGHNGAKPFLCSQDGCSKAFSKHHQLRAHISQSHSPAGTKPFICDHDRCSKSFNTNQHLKSHKKTHDPHRYTCARPECLAKSDEAARFFPTWSTLQHHLRTTHPPTCNHPSCNERTFASQKGLRAHMKLHEQRDLEAELHRHLDSDQDDDLEPPAKKPRRGGEIGRDWKCDFRGCDKDFKSKKALNVHRDVTHLGQRDFVCSECNKAFGYKHLLQRHAAKIHAHGTSPSDDDPEALAQEQEEPLMDIDRLTGKAYAKQAQADLAQGRRFRCPYPDLGDLVEQPALDTQSSEQPCSHVFSRLYDLRRHLDSAHTIKTDKEALARWMVRRKRLLQGRA